jgi:hypothetical protein
VEGLHYTNNRVEVVVFDVRPPGHGPERSIVVGNDRDRPTQLELSPLFYRTVRIHNGTLAGGILGGKHITIEHTKYWNFRSASVWQAIRDLQQPSRAFAH